MLPDLPSMLLHPDQQALKRIATLVNSIKCPSNQISLRNYFIQYYLHNSRSKIQQLKNLPNLVDVIYPQTKPNNKSRSQNKLKIYPEEMFLSNAIHNNLNWQQIAEQLKFNLVQKRVDWSYSYYLTFAIISRINKNLAYFIGIHLFDRSWLVAENTFNAVKASQFLTEKVKSLIQKDTKALLKIHFTFYRSLLLSIKYEQDIQTTLKRINYINLINLKKQKNEDINFFSEEWIGYLSDKFPKNILSEVPIIRIQKGFFTLKWTKSKISAAMKKEFDSKFKFVMNNIQDFEVAFINEIQIILLNGVKQKQSWPQAKESIIQFVAKMNQAEGQYSFIQQKTMKSVRSSRSAVTKRNQQQCGSQRFSQCCSFDEDYSNQKQKKMKTAIKPVPVKIASKKPKKSIQMEPVISQKESTHLSFNPQYHLAVTTQNIQTQTSFLIEQSQPRLKKDVVLNADQEIILSYIQIIRKELANIQKNSFQDIEHEDLISYYKQNIDQIQKKYTDTLNFFSADPEKVRNIQNLDLKTLISILIAISCQNKLKKQVKNQFISQAFSNKSQAEINNRATQEFDKINKVIKSKLNARRSNLNKN